jgi:hypothetical protein
VSIFKKSEPLSIGTWVLARHDADQRYLSNNNECHAGIIRHCEGSKYVVLFTFGLRWLSRGEFEPVEEQTAHEVDTIGVTKLRMPQIQAWEERP